MFDNFRYSCHFAHFGWTKPMKNYNVVSFGERLEAIRFTSEDIPLTYAVNDEVLPQKRENGEISGTTGQARKITKITICTLDKMYDCWYRLNVKKKGWSRWYHNGESFNSEEKEINGIQVFLAKNDEDVSQCFLTADRRLSEYPLLASNLYVSDRKRMLAAATYDYCNEQEGKITIVENGYVLPIYADEKDVFSGGILDENKNFIAGLDRKRGKRCHFSCLAGYEFSTDDVTVYEEDVIFGGIFIETFGHMLAECLCRLWYFVENPQFTQKIIILLSPSKKEQVLYKKFFELAGIPMERIMIIDRVSQFSKVIVPRQSVRLLSDFTPEYPMIYDHIRNRLLKEHKYPSYEKIYLSKTSFHKNIGINEEYYETFFKKRGFAIIKPEKLLLEEQIYLIANAKWLVATEGTLSHWMLFCNPSARFTILKRRQEDIIYAQMLINQAKRIHIDFIDISYNFLPTSHTKSVFLFGPTQYFRNFLISNNIKFEENELQFSLDQYLLKYLRAYVENYNQRGNFTKIEKLNMSDVMKTLNKVIGEVTENKQLNVNPNESLTLPMFHNQYMAHALGGYRGLTYLNNEAALQQTISMGHKFFEVDIKRTVDNHIVLSHGWDKEECKKRGIQYSSEFKKMSGEMFLSQTIHGMKTMDLSMLYAYMKHYPDFYWELDICASRTKEEIEILVKTLLEELQFDEEVFEHILIKIDSIDMYNWINTIYSFKYYQYYVEVNTTTDMLTEIINLCFENNICSIALHAKDATNEHIQMIRNAGLALLVYTLDNYYAAKRLLGAGVNTICTNVLSPAGDCIEQKQYTIAYNSGAIVDDNIKKLISTNVLCGKLKKTKKGFLVYEETIYLREDESYSLMGSIFSRENYSLMGWRARCRGIDDLQRWYCNDGSWKTKDEFKANQSSDPRKIFSQLDKVILGNLKPEGTIVFEALWQT